MNSTSRIRRAAAATPAVRREWMVNLSAVLFVLGMTGLALVVGLHQREEDAWKSAADAAFLEQREAIDALNEPRSPARNGYQHQDNWKYIGELGGCVLVLMLAGIVRYRSPRPATPVRTSERWTRTPAPRRRSTAPAQSRAELAGRVSAVVWGDRIAGKETRSGSG